nr:MAG TPA: hypothetical protein [Caudoviricetes sp.]
MMRLMRFRQCQSLLERLFSYFPRENINQRDLMY